MSPLELSLILRLPALKVGKKYIEGRILETQPLRNNKITKIAEDNALVQMQKVVIFGLISARKIPILL